MTRRRAAAALAAAVLAAPLAACTATPGAMEVRAIERERVLVSAAGSTLSLVAPEGFCVLPDSVRTSEGSVIALLTACAGTPPVPADLLTASVSSGPLFEPGASEAAELDRLEDFLSSERGLVLVGRGGSPGSLKILETHREENALIMLVQDQGDQVIPGASPRFWRAFLELDGRLVSLSAASLAVDAGAERAQLALIRRFIADLRAANARAAAPVPLG